MFLAYHFLKILVVCYFLDFPLILGHSILEMIGFTIVKPKSTESHSFSNKLKTTMISGYLLASFWHHCSCSSVTEFWIIFGLYLLGFYRFWFKKGHLGSASFGTHFWYLFDHGPQGCLWRFLGWFWLYFWFQFGCFGTFLAPFWFHFGIENFQQREREREKE